jgi:lipoate-protein ligase A
VTFSVTDLTVVEFGSHPGQFNMALDMQMLAACDLSPGRACLRFYTWAPPALSLGFFEPADAVDASAARARGVDIVRRPTGGRVVLHDQDLTYTVVLPRTGASATDVYRWISGRLIAGLEAVGVHAETSRGEPGRSAARRRPCFLSAARHEITSAGRKLVGSAQRLGRNALLQHGTIPIGGAYRNVVDHLACGDREKQLLRGELIASTTCIEEIVGQRLEVAGVAAALEQALVSGLGGPAARVSAGVFAAGVSGDAQASWQLAGGAG